jgi:hypothetical protein
LKLNHHYTFPILTAVLFVLALSSGVISMDYNPKTDFISPFVAKSLLSLAYIALAAWFLHAFTRSDRAVVTFEDDAEQRASMFRFAYFFSIFSFAILVLPFTAMIRSDDSPPDAGPIRLLRACVEQAAAPARAASSPSPVDLCPEIKGSVGTVTYPWLIAVGGVVARQCETGDLYCSQQQAAPPAPVPEVEKAQPPSLSGASAPLATPSQPAGGASSPGTLVPPQSQTESKPKAGTMYRVAGGFVVPFYVVVFAFVGGVVNLTRRVPEYQKRSSSHFAGTATESCVTLLEAREFVVFQLMQLLSSPFVAMMAYYALEPKSVASAVGVAFFSGFATESVLLLLRGMFAGLRPEPAKTAAADASTPATSQLLVTAMDAARAPLANATIELRSGTSQAPVVKTAMTDLKGQIRFLALPVGMIQIDASFTGSAVGATALKASKKVQLNAGAKESVELILA